MHLFIFRVGQIIWTSQTNWSIAGRTHGKIPQVLNFARKREYGYGPVGPAIIISLLAYFGVCMEFEN